MRIAGISEKHYSKIKDLGISNDSVQQKSCDPQVTHTVYLDWKNFRNVFSQNKKFE